MLHCRKLKISQISENDTLKMEIFHRKSKYVYMHDID
jgi:hypothetical protein